MRAIERKPKIVLLNPTRWMGTSLADAGEASPAAVDAIFAKLMDEFLLLLESRVRTWADKHSRRDGTKDQESDPEIVLFDMVPRQVDVIHAALERARRRELPISICGTNSLTDALHDAKAVLHFVERYDPALEEVERTLPFEFGVLGHELIGPTPFFRAIRSMTESLEIISVIAKIAPDALVLLEARVPGYFVQLACRHTDRGEARDVEESTGKAPYVVGLDRVATTEIPALVEAIARTTRQTGRTPRVDFSTIGLLGANWYSNLRLEGIQVPLEASRGDVVPDSADEEERLVRQHSTSLARRQPGGWPSAVWPYLTNTDDFLRLEAERMRRRRLGGGLSGGLSGSVDHEDGPRVGSGKVTHADRARRAIDASLAYATNAGGWRGEVTVLNGRLSATTSSTFDAETAVGARGWLSGARMELDPPAMPPGFLVDTLMRLEDHLRSTLEAISDGTISGLLRALTAHPLVRERGNAAKLMERARRDLGRHSAILS